MSGNIMKYKGYSARVEYSPADRCFVGRVLGIRDVVGFHGDSVAELERDFKETMEFYFDTCRKEGKNPDRPYTGKVVLHLPPELHRQIALESETAGKSIDDLVIEALREAREVQTSPRPTRKVSAAAKAARPAPAKRPRSGRLEKVKA